MRDLSDLIFEAQSTMANISLINPSITIVAAGKSDPKIYDAICL